MFAPAKTEKLVQGEKKKGGAEAPPFVVSHQ